MSPHENVKKSCPNALEHLQLPPTFLISLLRTRRHALGLSSSTVPDGSQGSPSVGPQTPMVHTICLKGVEPCACVL